MNGVPTSCHETRRAGTLAHKTAFTPRSLRGAGVGRTQQSFELSQWKRPGHEMKSEVLADLPSDRVSMEEIPALAISSTDCRERVVAGEPVWYLVPDGVVQYIGKYDLYRTGETE